jgi:peptidoglycan/xylan/chitin deacetylase (PgdA/CDA1 family)
MQLYKKSQRKAYTFLPLRALQVLNPRDVVCLFYHLVASQPLPHVQHLYQHRPVELFEQDLLYIKQHYQPVDTSQLSAAPARRPFLRAERKTALHISFDDGFVECFTLARPLLLKHGLSCTFFLATDFVDNRVMYYRNMVSLCISQVQEKPPEWFAQQIGVLNRQFETSLASGEDFTRWLKSLTDERQISQVCQVMQVDVAGYLRDRRPYLSREQVRTLASEGFAIGAHSRRHQKLGRLSPSEMADEIVGSCRAVAAMTGQASVPFSFPNSGEGVDRDFLAGLRKDHPEIGLIFDTRGLKKDRDFIINRIWVESKWLNPGGGRPLPEILRRAYLSVTG